MKIPCPVCNDAVPVIILFAAEKVFDTETKEFIYNDIDFNGIQCPNCYTNLGDDRDIPKDKKSEFWKLVEEGRKAT